MPPPPPPSPYRSPGEKPEVARSSRRAATEEAERENPLLAQLAYTHTYIHRQILYVYTGEEEQPCARHSNLVGGDTPSVLAEFPRES